MGNVQPAFDLIINEARNFAIKEILPITIGRMNAIVAGDGATVDILEPSFGR